ncbi:MAG: ATP-binding protein [Phycisphaerales bacterium]|nr:ATP-binding protein [Phycisphaerales bacterium]
MDQPADIRIQVLSCPSLLAPVRQAIEAWCTLAGAIDAERGRIGLAIDEALTNIIRHGYDHRPDGKIYIDLRRDSTSLQFIIEDEARQVPLSEIRSRDLDEIRPGGLGVHLIREVMDEAVWSHRPQQGMRLMLRKNLVETSKTVLESQHDT